MGVGVGTGFGGSSGSGVGASVGDGIGVGGGFLGRGGLGVGDAPDVARMALYVSGIPLFTTSMPVMTKIDARVDKMSFLNI